LGIISLAVCRVGFCIPFSGIISVVTGIVGAVTGAKANKIVKSTQATAGMIMSIVSLALSALAIIVYVAVAIFSFTLFGYSISPSYW
jgi:hypothetical protein